MGSEFSKDDERIALMFAAQAGVAVQNARLLEEVTRRREDMAILEERERIARELHDVVAHSMSVVAVHAGTGRMVAADDPAAAERALATIEATTRSALGEMRRLLGVLRSTNGDEPAALGPVPGLLPGLFARLFAGPLLPSPLVRRSLVPAVPRSDRLRFQGVHSLDVGEGLVGAVVEDGRGDALGLEQTDD